MDAVFIDRNGNKKNYLYQYDKGQYLKITDFPYSTAPMVHFSIKSISVSLPIQATLTDSTLYAFIPNDLLKIGEDITAYIYIENGTEGYVTETAFISVYPRKRPSDYVDSDDMPDIPTDDGTDEPIVTVGDIVYYGTYVTEDESVIPPVWRLTKDTIVNSSIDFTVNADEDNEYMYFFAPEYVGECKFQLGDLIGGWGYVGNTSLLVNGVSTTYKVYKTDWDQLGEVSWSVIIVE